MAAAENQAFQNDAFISHPWKDREFAGRLEKGLRNYKLPKGLNFQLHLSLGWKRLETAQGARRTCRTK